MNKKSIVIAATSAAMLIAIAGGAWLLSNGDGKVEHHGAAFTASVHSAPITDLVAKPQTALESDLRISGRIVRQCPSSGCWFFLKGDDGSQIKVELGDYLPKLPQHVGDDATVEGRLIRYGDKYLFIGKSVEFKEP